MAHEIYWAVRNVMTGNATINGFFTGFHPLVAPEGPTFPYVVYKCLASSPQWSTRNSSFENIMVQIDAYSPHFDDLNAIKETMKDAFNETVWIPLDAGRVEKFLRVSDWIWEDDMKRSENAEVIYRYTLNLNAMVNRNKN